MLLPPNVHQRQRQVEGRGRWLMEHWLVVSRGSGGGGRVMGSRGAGPRTADS